MIARNDPAELLYVPIVISMAPPECNWAESICVKLASHPHAQVRANAVLGFGHLARGCARLNEGAVRPILEAALGDEASEVRASAQNAIDDIAIYLGWRIGS